MHPALNLLCARAMALSPKSNFQAVHVYEPPYYAKSAYNFPEFRSIILEQQRQKFEDFLKSELTYFKKEHNGASSNLTGKMLSGPIYKTFLKKIKDIKADLITIGAHGRVGISPSKLGGIAEDILANPPCDVLVANDYI